MPNCKTVVPFEGTPEQEAALREAIAVHKDEEGSLISILHAGQEIYGYLPEEIMTLVVEEMGISPAEVYGTTTFYSLFSLNPKGEHQVSVCLGTACYVKGSADVLAEVEKVLQCPCGSLTPDGKFSVDNTRCIGACGLAPIMLVDGDVYGNMTPDRVADILKKYE